MIENAEQLVKQITHGVYVIGVSDGERQNAFTAAWVMQVSFDPLLLCFSINPEHYSWQLLQQGGICSINVLGKRQYAVAEHFGTSGLKDKMTGYCWQKAVSGAPILADSLAYFDCKVSHYAEAGDHRLAVCQVLDAGLLNRGKPMLYNETGDMDDSSELYAEASD
ncbi:flavin reductase family protein [Methylomarinum vadi]|uniref:flavin reductase family protein n=1 Tax=Methylomarinum vadi TaxID=438855 RepID=UPI0004DEF2BB|nr:flavin reductase family protein [Methylomarinum vadi]